jgi:hypothetical protein
MKLTETLQQEFEGLLNQIEIQPIDFEIGTKFSWLDLSRLSPEQYQAAYPTILAFENLKPKFRAKATKWIDPVYYAIFSKAVHLYMLLQYNEKLLRAELERMIKNDSLKLANTWEMNYQKLIEYLKTGMIYVSQHREGHRVGHAFKIDNKVSSMNELERKRLIEILGSMDFVKRTGLF